ncbi:MAG: glycosyltransferase family 2 protein [Akkermansiaceae bacterium]|nr:glycosyltransferase family 2 protein [Akkermansiaceae bacterium]
MSESLNSTDLSVGIVMRTKNRSVLLRRAIESVLNQRYQNWILVIVNDGGNPDEVDMLFERYKDSFKDRCKLIHNKFSLGMEAASNLGLNALSTDMGVIHDDDDSWAPEFLSRMISIYNLEKIKVPIRGIVCYCHKIFETTTGNIINIVKLENYNQHISPGILSMARMINSNIMPPICFMFDLSICKKIGMYDESLPVLGDWDFHIRYMMESDIWMIPESLAFYHHRVNATGDMGNSVNAGLAKHITYRKILENKWLRNDIKNAKIGIGSLLALTRWDSNN